MNNLKFDGAAVLSKIKAEQAKRKKSLLFKGSKLSQYRGEIAELRKAGASYSEIVYWLDTRKACLTNKTSIMRFIKNDQKTL